MNAPVQITGMDRTAESDAIYRQIRTENQFELNLVTARVNWLIASQAFLFMPLSVGVRQESLDSSLMYPMIPILGITICLLVLISISAAIWRGTQWRLKGCQGAYYGPADKHEFTSIIPRTPAIPYLGSCGALGVPVVLGSAWLYLLIWPGG